jgi:hypothetical protein
VYLAVSVFLDDTEAYAEGPGRPASRQGWLLLWDLQRTARGRHARSVPTLPPRAPERRRYEIGPRPFS